MGHYLKEVPWPIEVMELHGTLLEGVPCHCDHRVEIPIFTLEVHNTLRSSKFDADFGSEISF